MIPFMQKYVCVLPQRIGYEYIRLLAVVISGSILGANLTFCIYSLFKLLYY